MPRIPDTAPPRDVSELDFFLAGPGHSASTWLRSVLDSHPDIHIPPESNYVTWQMRHGEPLGRFLRGKRAKVYGEHGNDYFAYAETPEKFATLNPGAKLVFTIRDPVVRVLKAYRHDIRWGTLPRYLTLEVALLEDFFQHRYIHAGCHAYHLERWLKHFPAQQLFLYWVDNKANTEKQIADLFRFLGVGEYTVPNLDRRVNESVFTAIPLIHRHAWFGKMGIGKLLALAFEPVNRALGRLLYSPPQLTDEDRARIVQLLGPHATLDRLASLAIERGVPGAEHHA
jgi:hypothetical protein